MGLSEESLRYLGRWLAVLGTCAALLVFGGFLLVFSAPDVLLAVLHVPAGTAFSTTYSQEQVASLRKLGLSKKDPVVIVDPVTGANKTIHGRFLHLTDFHPDPYYKPNSDPAEMCHAGKKGGAGKYGDAILGCDSPMALVYDTVKWVKDNLGDKIDFIVWTGDNVRHDNDRRFPRTELNIFDLNQDISDLLHDNFGTLPIPSLGNNDVYPHNLFSPGPTLQTRELFKIWRPFVPQAQLHVFNRGAYFFHEVIPNHLAVLSINTLYLFQSNPLVDNCDSKKQPGYKLFEWLGNVLKEMRARKMKVWLTGHVPPNEKNYDISCLRKYIVWAHEYRDVIIGGLYGHMNIDHFIPLDSVQAYKSIKAKFAPLGFSQVHDFEEGAESEDDDDDDTEMTLEEIYSASNSPIFDDFKLDYKPLQSLRYDDIRIEGGIPNKKVGFLDSVRENLYAAIKGKKKAGKLSQRYSIAHVTASVVPTFNLGLRVWEYNITNLEEEINSAQLHMSWDAFFRSIDTLWDDEAETDYYDDGVSFAEQMTIFKRDKTFPPKMPKDLSAGPAYNPQTFTPERYVQYYADLAKINSGEKEFGYEISYATDDKPYNMGTLTVDEWIKLGRTLALPVKIQDADEKSKKKNGKKKGKKGKKKEKELRRAQKVWEAFLRHSFIDSNYENLGYG